MVIFPNCKINLGLHVIRKREDGYHDLETVFYPIDICDAVEIVTTNDTQPFQFSLTGSEHEINEAENLCIKACELLKKNFFQLPSVKIHLHKAIPLGAGLGGGSADAAFTLILLNKKFQLNLSADQLLQYAAQLGSDCPFFIINKPCFARGRGEILETIELDLSTYCFLIVNPGINISTRWAFSKIKPATPTRSLKQIIQQPVESWKELLANDFEEPVMQHYPLLRSVKENLYNLGAFYAAMSGSGSTFFGIFPGSIELDTGIFSPEYFVKRVDGL